MKRRLALLAAAVTAATGVALAGTGRAAASSNDDKYASPADPVKISVAAAQQEAQLVAAEDRRLQDIRTVSTLARWQKRAQHAPYRVGTPSSYTLVLTARSQPYDLSDLLQLEPQTLLRLSDGSYLLKENIVLLAGAELDLGRPTLVLRLASNQDGFTSIVSYGGRLKLIGSPGRPLTITSWNLTTGRPDTDTADGRAYVRAIGGQVQLSYVDVSDLGFWSGRTGGLSLTGTDRPNTGSLDVKAVSSTGSIGGLQVLPTGPLPRGQASSTDNQLYTSTYVAARIDHVHATGNAIGLFVSGADGIAVADSQFLDSQIAGVDLHRFVTASTIERTVSNGSGGAGFNLGRATQGVQLIQCTARGNATDGFVLSGEPLANGPSAVGSPIGRYGDNLLSNSLAAHNRHYGVFVKNGFNVTVSSDTVRFSKMGIVVTERAKAVNLNSNSVTDVTDPVAYGIVLIDNVQGAKVYGNTVTGGRIYLRNSSGTVRQNVVINAPGHGISIVGRAGGTSVLSNVVSGTGSSAIDTARSIGTVQVAGNNDVQWHDTTGLLVRYWHAMLHPMSLLWAAILALALVSMVMGVRRGEIARGTNPYARPGGHFVYTHHA